MHLRYAALGICVIASALLATLALSNLQGVPLSLCGVDKTVPFGAGLLVALVVGALTGLSAAQIKTGKVKGEKRKLEWDAQDAKLAAEIKSDREKQLEAKIATLEAALKQALKKSS